MAQPKRKGERRLDEKVILDAALKLIRRRGFEKFGMRALARELGVSPMAIYHHVPSKSALLERIRESAIALVPARDQGSLAKSTKARPPLTEPRIIEAGLALVRRRGAHRLSMRGLATALGVSPMALYRYVPDRDELLDRLRDSVLSRIDLPEPSALHWREQMRAYVLEAVMGLIEYPGLVRPGVGRPITDGDRRLMRYGISVLLAAGFEPAAAASALGAYQTQGFGYLMLADHLSRRSKASAKRVRSASSASAAATKTRPRDWDLRAAVRYGLDTMLQGLASQLAEAQAEAIATASAESATQRKRRTKRAGT